jgi:outer membrane protein OmpA-like peptidoglycan-associated protein
VLPVALVAVVAVSGCATKKFVREELQKSEAKTATEVGRIDQALAQGDTKVSGVAAQVVEVRTATEAVAKSAQDAGAKAAEADGKAVQADGKAVQAANRAEAADMRAGQAMGKAEEAGTMANQAMAKATETDQRLTRLWKDRNNRTLGDTVVIQFGFDKFQLDDKGQTALLEVVRALEQNPGAIVDLEGYTDNAGDSGYNVQLSQRRADAVRRFLVDKGVALHRIQSLGLGDARPVAGNNNRQGREQNRRVAVKMYTPSGD